MGFHNAIKDGRDSYFGPVKLNPCSKCHSVPIQEFQPSNLFRKQKVDAYYYVVCEKCKKRGPKKINEVLSRMAWNGKNKD